MRPHRNKHPRLTRLRGLTTIAVTAGLILGTWAADAHAAMVFKNVDATSVTRIYLTLSAGQSVTLETTNLSPGGDTVMHLWDTASQLEVAYDDDGGAGLASRIAYTNPYASTRGYYLVVRAYSTASQGTADLLKDGAPYYSGIDAGGSRISVPCGAAYHYETALAPNGTPDTYLYGLSSTVRLRAMDDDAGVGLGSRISGRTDICQVVVSHYPYSTPGATHLYVNDHWNDNDGDGLGASLESGLATCDDTASGACTSVFNAKDSDRDGLPDGAEVFGVDDSSFPQYLPRWGADPRHKDVFIEVDYTADFSSNPLVGVDAEEAQSYYIEGQASSLQNPDGVDGVNVHIDIGTNPSDPSLATLYGNWGGSNQVPIGTAYGSAPDTYRAAVRSGLFHYGLASPGSGGGQGWLGGDRFGWGVTTNNRYMRSFAHELGHNVNIHHYGHADWGAANCKPHYRSLMNYAFGDPNIGFSQGDSSMTLNPRFAAEDVGLGAGTDPSYLAGTPYSLATSGEMVDWNRDGIFSPSGALVVPWGFVRAPLTWGTWYSCNALDRAAQTLYSGATYGSTPSLVRRGDRLYAFWVSTGQRIHYRQGTLTSDGTCPGGEGLDDQCISWGNDLVVPHSQNAKAVSAVLWNGSTVVLAFRAAPYDNINYLYTSSIDAAGNLTGWSTEQAITNTYTVFEPELTVMQVSSSIFGTSQVLAVIYRNKTDNTYRWATTPAPWSTWTHRGNVIDSAGATLTGALSPTVATIEDGSASQHCGVFVDDASVIRFHCYDKNSNRWTNLTSQAFASRASQVTLAKPGLAYHVLRDYNGDPIRGDDTEGQFHLAVVTTGEFPDIYISDMLSSSTPANPNIHFASLGKFGNVWTRLLAGTGIELFDDTQVAAMKGLWVNDNDSTKLQFLPLADGSFEAALEDGDDFEIMERGVCLGVSDSAFCGNASDTVSGL